MISGFSSKDTLFNDLFLKSALVLISPVELGSTDFGMDSSKELSAVSGGLALSLRIDCGDEEDRVGFPSSTCNSPCFCCSEFWSLPEAISTSISQFELSSQTFAKGAKECYSYWTLTDLTGACEVFYPSVLFYLPCLSFSSSFLPSSKESWSALNASICA